MKPKRCKECGKLFVPRCGTQIFCAGPHTAECVICGKSFLYTCRPSEHSKTCSKQCQEKLKEQTVMRVHGVKNVSELDWVRKKISAANTDEVKAKRAATSFANTGYDNPSKSPAVRKKLSEIMKTEKYLKGREATCLEIYGAKSPMQTDAVKLKQKSTNRERYNMDGHPHTRQDYMKMMVDPSKVDAYLAFKSDPARYIQETYKELPIISQLEQDLGVTNTTIYDVLIDAGCREFLATTYSTMEDEVVAYIESTVPDVKLVRNDRTVIKPYELDIYLPEYNIGIECNPVSTHNSSFQDPWGADPKPCDYHQMKSKLAAQAGVFLLHIFGYEWVNKKSIIKSMISNILHANKFVVAAEHTSIVELDSVQCKDFLAANHYLDNESFDIKLGLIRQDTYELVSVMVFNSCCSTSEELSSEYEYELVCASSALYTNVTGGVVKLFDYFINNYHPRSVVAYSDIAHVNSDMYDELGFKGLPDKQSLPDFIWVSEYDKTSYNRGDYKKLIDSNMLTLTEGCIDADHIDEVEFMEAHKFARVYDCGQAVYVWTREDAN